MTFTPAFKEFLEKCREKNGWRLQDAWVLGEVRQVIRRGLICPLEAVFGPEYNRLGREAMLSVEVIMDAADGYTNGPYRKALLGLVKS